MTHSSCEIQFESKSHVDASAGLARSVFERAVEFFGEEHMDESLLSAFAAFEEQCKEVRACSC